MRLQLPRGPAASPPTCLVRYREPSGRWVLLAAVLGSALTFIDATVVNVALPRIGAGLRADGAGLQWIVNGYNLTLASLILLGGSLSDLFGRRRVFVIGLTWFAGASLLCGVSPSVETLILARLAQGVGGALLTPGALAILQTSFVPEDRSRAIGAWSGLGGIAGAVGPFLGGWLVEVGSWRLIFLVNLPLAALAIAVALRHVRETRDPGSPRRLDLAGALLAAAGLAGTTYGLTAWPGRGLHSPDVLAPLALGGVASIGFVLAERKVRNPMLPLEVFESRVFTAANLVTLVVYAALGGVFFLLVLDLQVVAGFEPLAAGTALLPITVIMLLLSSRAGALADRVGPRLPMTVGPLVCAAALVLLARVGTGASYLRTVLPGAVVLGLGLSLTVAPLTAAVLGALDPRHAGVASGVNNAVARAAGLLAVAALPLAAGFGGGTLTDASTLAPVYRTAMLLCAGLLATGAATALVGIPSSAGARPADAGAPGGSSGNPPRFHCAIGSPASAPPPGAGGAARPGRMESKG